MVKTPYGFTNTPTVTSQSKPIPGREQEMTQSLSGGFAFKADSWTALRRWLLTGSMGNAFYQGKEEMTDANVKSLMACIKEDVNRVSQEILDASFRGVSVHTPLYALSILSTGDMDAKNAFRELFQKVVRNSSQLYEELGYIKGHRGFGSLIHKTVKDWFASKDAKELEYQFLKYQGRYNWTGRDVLRIIKPVPHNDDVKAMFNWIAGGSKSNPTLTEWPDALERIRAYEYFKKGNASEKDIVEAINKYKMTWEMMPSNLTQTKKIWEALFINMPVNATIRNLGNLTEKEIFTNTKNLDILEERFSIENLRKAHVHPINLASALKVYENNGLIGKSKLTWNSIPRVIDIMEKGIGNCFDAVEPTGKKIFIATDVSGSMTCGLAGNVWLNPLQTAGILALSVVRSEKNYFIGGFDTKFSPLNIKKSTSYSDVMTMPNVFKNSVWPSNFGGTDASSAYSYAIDNKIDADVFVFITDSESWAGHKHPSQSLGEYRSKFNKNAKAIYITLVPYGDHITLADPNDRQSYDIAGFTSETPSLINMIINEDF